MIGQNLDKTRVRARSALLAPAALVLATCISPRDDARAGTDQQAANGMALSSPEASLTGDARAPLLIGVGIHRQAPGFDLERTAAALREFGFDGTRDELGNAGFDAGPASAAYPAHALPALSALDAATTRRGHPSGDVITLTGGGSRRYVGGLPLVAADRAAYAHFAATTAAQLHGAAPMLEIFNEWNLPTSLRAAGAPEDYAATVRDVTPLLRAAAPGSAVLVGAIGNDFRRDGGQIRYWEWTNRFLDTGAWTMGAGLSVHIYANCMSGADRLPAAMVARLRMLEAAITARNQGLPFPLYLTEVGWPAMRGACGFTPEERLAFPAQFLLQAATLPWLRGVWLYELTDKHTGSGDIEDNFGILDDAYRPKPESCGLRAAMRLIRGVGVSWVDSRDGWATAWLGRGVHMTGAGIARVVWAANGGSFNMRIPAGMVAQPLCAPASAPSSIGTPDAALATLHVTIHPVVIYRPDDGRVGNALADKNNGDSMALGRVATDAPDAVAAGRPLGTHAR